MGIGLSPLRNARLHFRDRVEFPRALPFASWRGAARKGAILSITAKAHLLVEAPDPNGNPVALKRRFSLPWRAQIGCNSPTKRVIRRRREREPEGSQTGR